MALVAIHQPNFFPWLGFFNKAASCDRFIFLDDVQYERKGAGSWVNRVKLAGKTEPFWVTLPVQRTFSGVRAILEMKVDNRQPWRRKLVKTVHHRYSKTPHFREILGLLEPLITFSTESLVDYNLHTLQGLFQALEIPWEKTCRSSLLSSRGTATERLISLVQAVGGKTYLSGRLAAETYHDQHLFDEAGIEVIVQSFRPPLYPRGMGEPVAGLSLIDVLFHCGVSGARRLVRDTTP